MLPVKVIEVVEGETNEQTISVVQYNDWGAIPMKNDTEYLVRVLLLAIFSSFSLVLPIKILWSLVKSSLLVKTS